MKYRLMDLLACPYCKLFPLKLIIFEKKYYGEREIDIKKIPFCEKYCSFYNKDVEVLSIKPDCKECIKYEIISAMLICEKCNRWYPVIEEIPILLPDELRNKNEDIEFLQKYRDKIPKKILEEGIPFNLSSHG